MRLVTFEVATPVGKFQRIGEMRGDTIVDFTAATALQLRDERQHPQPLQLAGALAPPDMIAFLDLGDAGLETAAGALDFVAKRGGGTDIVGIDDMRVVYGRDEIKLLAPLPRPRTLRDFSVYHTHALQKMGGAHNEDWHTRLTAYKGNPQTVVGPEDDILWPRYTEQLDLELEFGAVIGKRGKNIPVDEGESHVVGYTIYIDCSARDAQGREWLGPFKGKDFCTVLGPCIVTTDEFDYRNARAWYDVDGERWWEGNTNEPRAFFTDSMVAWASAEEELLPGEVLGSGTVGEQCSFDTGRWIKPGASIEIGIEGLGVLSHNVVRETTETGPVGMDAGIVSHLSPKDYV